MKVTPLIALAAASTAFVTPDPHAFAGLEVRPRESLESTVVDDARDVYRSVEADVRDALHRVGSAYEGYASQARSSLDEALAYAEDAAAGAGERLRETYFDAQGWLESARETWDEEVDYSTLGHGHGDHPHHPHEPHHPHHPHHRPNMTVYQLIATSKYTTKLAKLISKYDDLVEALNGTSANFTVFAPTDRAFEKIPKHAPEPSKEFLKAVLAYHVSPEFYPAGRILVSRTIPTLLNSSALGKTPLPQRLSTNIGLKGLTVNFYSRVVAVDIFGTNGVIHGVDSFIIPPPSILKIIDLLPSEFSTLELGLGKTGLFEELNRTTQHNGGTFFAPSNYAFAKLGARVNAFLFSDYGLKYLRALLQYHVVAQKTLYSDAFYDGTADAGAVAASGIPKGHFHVDLQTELENRTISVDVARYGRLIEIKLNSFNRVSVADGVAYDGVLHVLNSVLIPPKTAADGTSEAWDDSQELTVEELRERLEPFVGEAFSDEL